MSSFFFLRKFSIALIFNILYDIIQYRKAMRESCQSLEYTK